MVTSPELVCAKLKMKNRLFCVKQLRKKLFACDRVKKCRFKLGVDESLVTTKYHSPPNIKWSAP